MTKAYRILVINPGSTSTKVAVFEDKKQFFMTSIFHSEQDLKPHGRISDQHAFRVRIIEDALKKNAIDIKTMDGVVGRGGLLHPIPGGTYGVNDRMVEDLKEARFGEHASNLGAIIAHDIGRALGIPAFIVDSPVVDEMDPVARITGMPELERRSIFHALNQKAIARMAAHEMEKEYEEVNLIVVHLGGGISVGVHKKGRVVDVNNAFDGDGPFAPERAGGLPAGQLVELCFSGKFTKEELKKRLVGNAGIVAHLGTNDMRKVKGMVEAGDEKARLVYEAMAYCVAKEIGGCAAVLKGEVDGIVLSGGLAYDEEFVAMIRERVRWIGRIFVSQGEKEMQALALGAVRVLQGKEEAKVYT
ncbi:MAG: butyrate kinase [bacterium]